MAKHQKNAAGLARFGDPAVLVLLSLSGGAKHGYALTADIKDSTGIALGPGTLYGCLTKLVDLKLISKLPAEGRQQPYEITQDGRAALDEQLVLLDRMIGMAPPGIRRIGVQPA
jgi:DNA-binding PadR family transcriptional regulator